VATTTAGLKLQTKEIGGESQHVDGDHLPESYPEHPEGSACIIEEVEGQHFGANYDPFACMEE
jgi:hypothetical protein